MPGRATKARRRFSAAIRRVEVWLAVGMLVAGSSCTTTRSRPLSWSADGTWCEAAPASKGIPVTIRVPTHVEVAVYEKLYFQRVDDHLQRVDLRRPVRWVDVRGIETNQVVTVDWKRPLSGTLEYSAKLGSDQFFDALNAKVSDTTLDDVTAAVQALAAVPTRAAGGGTAALLEEDRLIAFRRFALTDCAVETEIVDFVSCHLLACTPPGSPADGSPLLPAAEPGDGQPQ